jgi:hypothetical protein
MLLQLSFVTRLVASYWASVNRSSRAIILGPLSFVVYKDYSLATNHILVNVYSLFMGHMSGGAGHWYNNHATEIKTHASLWELRRYKQTLGGHT